MAVDIRVDTVMRLIGQYDADITVNDGSPYRADRLSRIASCVVFSARWYGVKTGHRKCVCLPQWFVQLDARAGAERLNGFSMDKTLQGKAALFRWFDRREPTDNAQ
ncbi:hypothetical protein [Bifidobacterium asteroides]|uniref:hypothetical protein n=1 Tax=Bifidobacterium asteroides TaxID=1684 RepID=UPI0027417B62|nr:hypothetical protein [Bifidobacterium asteroides]WLT11044.1 hypothetical protein RAM15_01930 [Bifidobacterium asteroides]